MKKKTTFYRYSEHEEFSRLNYKEQLGSEDWDQKTKLQRTVGVRRLNITKNQLG